MRLLRGSDCLSAHKFDEAVDAEIIAWLSSSAIRSN